MEQARDRQDRGGFAFRPQTQPQGSDHREYHTEATADCTQTTSKATAVDPGRPDLISFVGLNDGVLAASIYCPAGHAAAVASRSVPSLLAVQIETRNENGIPDIDPLCESYLVRWVRPYLSKNMNFDGSLWLGG